MAVTDWTKITHKENIHTNDSCLLCILKTFSEYRNISKYSILENVCTDGFMYDCIYVYMCVCVLCMYNDVYMALHEQSYE